MKTKYCPKCKQDKPLTKFNKDKHTKSGYHGWCKECQSTQSKKYRSNPDVKKSLLKKDNVRRVKRYNEDKEFRDKKKSMSRSYWLASQYDLSIDDYDIMMDKQGGCCAICGTHQDDLTQRLAVDHNHETGEIRGLLCTSCNVKVGWYETWFKKQKENLINYLGE